MALPNPITVAQEAKLIKEGLEPYVLESGGSVDVVSNLKELWNQSALNSQSPRVLICYMGEDSRGSFEQISRWHRVDRKWTVAVTKGRGYFSNRGSGLYDQTATEIPLYDVVESIRDQIRFNNKISAETPSPDYRSIKPMSLGNLVLDGYTIEFTTANDIPQVESPI